MIENLQQLERQVFRSYWDDGLLDVVAAVGVFLIGIFWLRDLPVGAAIVPPLLIPFWPALRQKLIEPRLGHVEFTEERERSNTRNLKLVAWLGIGTLVLALELYFFRDSLPALLEGGWIAGLPAMLLGLLAAITGLLIGGARFVGYAVILIIAGLAGAALGWEPGLILAVAGAVLLAFGGVRLVRFLIANPVLESTE